MSNKITAVTIVLLVLCTLAAKDKSEQNDSFQIYIPREISVDNADITIGDAVIIRADDNITEKICAIPLGTISAAGGVMVIEKETILGRLSYNGFTTSDINTTGADSVTIKLRQQTIKGSEILETAKAFFGKKLPDKTICQFIPIRNTNDIVIPGAGKQIRFLKNISKVNSRNHSKVTVKILADGNEVAATDIIFRLKYNCKTTVTTGNITKGSILSSDNCEIKTKVLDYPQKADWNPPYGLAARRYLPKGITVREDMVWPLESETIIKRNQAVIILIERPGLTITATGKAIQEGKVGELIRVQNIDSQRIIMARVNEAGSVSPVY